ncbi:hypothetical protein L208DRAFT_661523 [Tricholoma matsutake]|nr:hypothetical protein L208DRAFT_661523 [Tricholoma matsutake 945]
MTLISIMGADAYATSSHFNWVIIFPVIIQNNLDLLLHYLIYIEREQYYWGQQPEFATRVKCLRIELFLTTFIILILVSGIDRIPSP